MFVVQKNKICNPTNTLLIILRIAQLFLGGMRTSLAKVGETQGIIVALQLTHFVVHDKMKKIRTKRDDSLCSVGKKK